MILTSTKAMATMETNIMVVAIVESETVEDAVNETITLDVRIILTTDVPGVMLRDVSTADLGPIHGIIIFSFDRKKIYLLIATITKFTI
jgi:hypothetical protein